MSSKSFKSSALPSLSRLVFAVTLLIFSCSILPSYALSAQVESVTGDQVASVIAKIRSPSASEIKLSDAYALGELLISQKRFKEAYSLFTAVLEKHPDDLTALYGAGLAAFNNGDQVEAEKLARAATEIAIAPIGNETASREQRAKAADALVLLAVVLAVRGNDAEALQAAQRAVNFASDHFDAQFTLGRALFSTGDMTRAAAAFRAAIALKPGDSQTLFFLGTTLEKSGDITAAITTYRQLIAQQPDVAQGHLGLGSLLVRDMGARFEEGIAELKRALEIDPNSYEARVALGRALITNGKYAESVDHLVTASRLEPQNPEPHFQLSIAYRRLGLKDKSAQEAAIVKQIHASRRTPNATTQKP